MHSAKRECWSYFGFSKLVWTQWTILNLKQNSGTTSSDVILKKFPPLSQACTSVLIDQSHEQRLSCINSAYLDFDLPIGGYIDWFWTVFEFADCLQYLQDDRQEGLCITIAGWQTFLHYVPSVYSCAQITLQTVLGFVICTSCTRSGTKFTQRMIHLRCRLAAAQRIHLWHRHKDVSPLNKKILDRPTKHTSRV